MNLLDIRSSHVPKVLALAVHGPDRAFSYPHFFAGVNCALLKINFERLGKIGLKFGNRFGRKPEI